MRKATYAATMAAVLGFSGAALADGMYSKPAASYKDAPIVVSGPVWTGFYVGAGVGAGSVVHDLEIDSGNKGLGFDGIGGEGIFGTIQAGYDRQVTDRIVLGAFIDYDFSGIETEIDVDFGSNANLDIELEDMWSIGARLGILLNQHTMLYGLLAYTEASFDAGDLDEVFDIDNFSGYSIGAGLETNLHGNWFLKAEYRFTQLDGEDILKDFDERKSFGVSCGDCDDDIGVDLEPSIHTARLVLTYKFGRSAHHEPLK